MQTRPEVKQLTLGNILQMIEDRRYSILQYKVINLSLTAVEERRKICIKSIKLCLLKYIEGINCVCIYSKNMKIKHCSAAENLLIFMPS